MNYVYPELSSWDFGFVRISGVGLGNMLYTYTRALVFADRNKLPLIWPSWANIPVGRIISCSADKRLYRSLFVNCTGCIDGFNKMRVFASHQTVSERYGIEKLNDIDRKIIVFKGMENTFETIEGYHEFIKDHLTKNINPKNNGYLNFDPKDAICIHIRLGDFYRATEDELILGKHNASTHVSWYCGMITQIRGFLKKEIKVFVFSDGTNEELSNVLVLPNVERVTFGSPISDIMAMSKAKLFLSSGSSFSQWARYLGRMNVIAFKGQLHGHFLLPDECAFEVEVKDIIDADLLYKIGNVFKL